MAEAKAVLKHVHIGPRKARLVVDMIRGKRVEDAFNTLRFLPRHASKTIEKLLKSAVANAEQKQIGDIDDLVITRATVDGGPVMKRVQPRAQGRAFQIRKRLSHITLVVEPKETGRKGKKEAKGGAEKAKPASAEQ